MLEKTDIDYFLEIKRWHEGLQRTKPLHCVLGLDSHMLILSQWAVTSKQRCIRNLLLG